MVPVEDVISKGPVDEAPVRSTGAGGEVHSTEDIVILNAGCTASDVEDSFVGVVGGGDASASIVLERQEIVVTAETPVEDESGTVGVEGGSDADGGSEDGSRDVGKELGLVPRAGGGLGGCDNGLWGQNVAAHEEADNHEGCSGGRRVTG